jgi:hypothetical protein
MGCGGHGLDCGFIWVWRLVWDCVNLGCFSFKSPLIIWVVMLHSIVTLHGIIWIIFSVYDTLLCTCHSNIFMLFNWYVILLLLTLTHWIIFRHCFSTYHNDG